MKPKLTHLPDEWSFIPKTGKGKSERVSGKHRGFYGALRAKMRGTFSSARSSARQKFGRGILGRNPGKNRQRVTVKARFQKHSKASSFSGIKRHIVYLTREGVNRDGQQAELFNQAGHMSRKESVSFTESWTNDRHHWRLIVSPENGHKLPLEEFAARFMERLEEDLNTKLNWVAAAHYDTENPHIHFLIRGKTEQGEDLVISKQYVAYGMRDLAEELATQFLGPRKEWEIHQALEKSVTQERFGEIDSLLLKDAKKNPGGYIDVSSNPWSQPERIARLKVRRLKFLKELGLSRRIAPGVWQVADNFPQVLRELSIKNDIIKTMHARMKSGRENLQFDTEKHDGVSGRVIYKGLIEPLGDNTFLLLEGRDGKNYYVPLTRYSEQKEKECRVGDVVSINSVGFSKKPMDEVIRKIAKEEGGSVTEELVRRYVVRERLVPEGRGIDGYWRNIERRLQALSRREIVTKLSADRWGVPADFEQKIREKTVRYPQVTIEERGKEKGRGL